MSRQRAQFPHRGYQRHRYRPQQWQWQQTQFGYYSCFWRNRSGWLPWQSPAQQLGRLEHTCKRNTQITPMVRNQRRSASRRIGLYRPPRMGNKDSLSHWGHNQHQPQHPQNHLEKWYTNTWTHCALHKSKQISQTPYYGTLPSSMNMIQQN